MTTRTLLVSHGRRIRSAGAARPRPDGVTVSPAIGPLPAIYVPAPIGRTMPETPVDLRYSKDHLWARPDPGTGLIRVGVTDFAQQPLGDVAEVTLPRQGSTVNAGETCGDIESVKSVSDLIAPVTGTVRTRNDDLAGAPELVNTNLYRRGWMFGAEIDPSALNEQLASPMDAGAYRSMAGA